MSDFRVGVSADTTKFTKDIKTVAEKTTVTVKVKADGTTDKITTSMKKTTDSANNLTTSIQKFNSEGKVLSSTVTKSSKAVKGLGTDFVDTLGKVAKFGAVTAIIGLFTSAIGEAVSAVKDFDDAVTDFKKVSDLSGDSLDNYTQKLGELGESVARTRTEMVQNAATMKQAGFSDEDAAQLAKLAAEYQNVADAEISASEASSFLVSQMKAYNLNANEAETILDQLNEVDTLAFPIRNFRVIKDNYIG